MAHDDETLPAADEGPVQRTVRPRAWAIFVDSGNVRMWSTFQPHVQKLADAEGLEVTPLYGRAALDALVAERDGLMQTLRDDLDENLRLRELGGALPDENITAMTERLIRERDALRAVTARMVAGIDHLDKLTREWEPDHSSGADRRGWLLAKDARDDAARALGPNARLTGPKRPLQEYANGQK